MIMFFLMCIDICIKTIEMPALLGISWTIESVRDMALYLSV